MYENVWALVPVCYIRFHVVITVLNLLILLNYINMKNNFFLDVGSLYVE